MEMKENDTFKITATAFFTIFSILSIWFLWKMPFLMAFFLFILAVIELNIIKSKKLVVVFILAAIFGSAIESMAIYLGSWHYSNPTFFNIPIWLIPLWGNAGIITVSLYKLLGKFSWLEKD